MSPTGATAVVARPFLRVVAAGGVEAVADPKDAPALARIRRVGSARLRTHTEPPGGAVAMMPSVSTGQSRSPVPVAMSLMIFAPAPDAEHGSAADIATTANIRIAHRPVI